MLKLIISLAVDWCLGFTGCVCREQWKILGAYVREKKDKAGRESLFIIKDPFFIGLSRALWRKVAISRNLTDAVASQFTVKLSKMKISNLNIQSPTFFQWQMLVRTLMGPSSF